MQTSGQSDLLLDCCEGLRQPQSCAIVFRHSKRTSIAGAAVVSLSPAG